MRSRLTMLAVGALLVGLAPGGLTTRPDGSAPAVSSDIRLAAQRCPSFTAHDVLRGRTSRRSPTCRPVGIDGQVVTGPIERAVRRDLRTYGDRAHGRRRHLATDYRAPCALPVHAAHDGRVVVLDSRRRGQTVGVSTGPRRLTTWYSPLRRLRVREGAVVDGGQTLGLLTRSSPAPRCRLHVAVHLRAGARDPQAVNPTRWLRRNAGRHVSGMPPGDPRSGSFVVASFNVLGDSHTSPGGKKHRRFAGSRARMAWTVGLLRSNHVSIVGLQEFQGVQRAMFHRMTSGWTVFSPRDDPQDSIAWRRSRFELLHSRILMIPYFRGDRPMPIVLLRDRATGRRVVVISVHNPANRGPVRRMERRRAEAVGRELRMAAHMRRTTRAPVILMGDFNDRSRELYCRMVRRGLKASSRGEVGRACRPSQAAGIDWIFGTPRVRFTAHQKVLGGVVGRTSDHPLVLALARVRR